MELLSELTGVKVPNRARLNFAGIDLRILHRLFTGFDDDMPDRFTFLLQVALKIRAPTSENINFVHISLLS